MMLLTLLALVPFAFSMTASPGPSNVIVLVSSTNFGYRRTLPVMLGLISGLTFMIFAMGLGLSQVFNAYPVIHSILKTVSIAYLLYMAWNIFRADKFRVSSDSEAPKAMTFTQGLAFQCVNPKAWVVALSIVATYTSVEHNLLLQILLICFTFYVIAFISLSTWAIFGTMFARFLQSPKSLRIFNAGLAGTLVLSVLPIIG